jgi:hypothetical protein
LSFDRFLGSTFPGAVDESAFVSATSTALQPLGFSRENTLACLATCRDEISQSWAISVTEAWGYPFSLTGLGGLILAGRVGFGAALAHAPNPDGRERYLFLAGPHVAIGTDGEPGVCARPGRSGSSTACGALAAVLKELQADGVGPVNDPDDVEIGWLRQRVSAAAAGREIGDLFDLTVLTHDLIAAELERTLADVVDTSKTDYAVATGIQIHAPGDRNLIQPRAFYANINGERRQVPSNLELPA